MNVVSRNPTGLEKVKICSKPKAPKDALPGVLIGTLAAAGIPELGRGGGAPGLAGAEASERARAAAAGPSTSSPFRDGLQPSYLLLELGGEGRCRRP